MKNLLAWSLARLLSQSGQVPDEGEVDNVAAADQDASGASDTGEPTGGQPQGGETQPQEKVSFFDPKAIDTLPVDDAVKAQLRQTWKAMHGGYNKWIQTERNPLQQKAEMVDRFYNDRNFAQQTLVQWAAQNGYQLVPYGQQIPAGQPQQSQPGMQNVPAEYLATIKQSLPPELQWMAESMAAANWAAQQLAMKPFQAQREQQEKTQRDRAYEEAAAELREHAPDWEQREADVLDLFEFVISPEMKHPKYGNKLEMLWNFLTSNQAAVAEATDRMSRAAKNRSSSATVTARTVPNLQDRIVNAKSGRDAFRLAAQAALNQQGR